MPSGFRSGRPDYRHPSSATEAEGPLTPADDVRLYVQPLPEGGFGVLAPWPTYAPPRARGDLRPTGPWRLLATSSAHHADRLRTPIFLMDQERVSMITASTDGRVVAEDHDHDWVADLLRIANRDGPDALFGTMAQTVVSIGRSNPFDFSVGGAYSLYNWELVLHVPLLIAGALSRSQRFEAARRWYEYVFDPTAPRGSNWRASPLQDDNIEARLEALEALARGTSQDLDLERAIADWQEHPFDPHVVAGLRPTAYRKAVVMAYLDNLIAWADHLFAAADRESVNQAAQIYAFALDLLGPRPQRLPGLERPEPTWSELVSGSVSSGWLGARAVAVSAGQPVSVPVGGSTPLPMFDPIFCLPSNPELLAYWDTVDDRLTKLRNCLSIEGEERDLSLLAPRGQHRLAGGRRWPGREGRGRRTCDRPDLPVLDPGGQSGRAGG